MVVKAKKRCTVSYMRNITLRKEKRIYSDMLDRRTKVIEIYKRFG